MSSNEKVIKSRQQQKTDVSTNWKTAGDNGFIPKKGEIIVYGDLNKIKIGDGTTNVNKLPFVEEETYINVAALPEGNINDKIAYRVLEGTFVGQKRFRYDATCHVVETLPETGESALVQSNGDLSYVGYYNINDNEAYAYINNNTKALLTQLIDESNLNTLAKLAAKAVVNGMATGWKTFKEFINLIGSAVSVSWGGVVYTLEEITSDTALYLFIGAKTFYRNNGVWTSGDYTIGRRGTDSDAEVFNDLNNVASAPYAHAEGSLTIAGGAYSHAEGYMVESTGLGAHAEGQDTHATGTNSHTEGGKTYATHNYAHAEGYSTQATNWYAHAEGVETEATAIGSHAEGGQTNAFGQYSHAEGQAATASGDYSHAEGRATTASKAYAHAEGCEATADGDGAHAEGYKTNAIGGYSHAEGNKTQSKGNSSHSEGEETEASGWTAHAEGNTTKATALAAHAEGLGSQATSDSAHAEGHYTIASGTRAHAEGQNTKALKNASHAEGGETKADGQYTHAEGYKTIAESGWGAHAEGGETLAKGNYAHAEGGFTQAIGDYSHAEGQSTKADGIRSHAEGHGTVASGKNAHAEGYNTVAGNLGFTIKKIMVGDYYDRGTYRVWNDIYLDSVDGIKVGDYVSCKLGDLTYEGLRVDSVDTTSMYIRVDQSGVNTGEHESRVKTEEEIAALSVNYAYVNGKPYLGTKSVGGGNNSHAGGLGTIASEDNQTAIGKYNEVNSNALFIVGNGVDNDNRDNAFVVNEDGSAEVYFVDEENSNSVVNVEYINSKSFGVGKKTGGGEVFNAIDVNIATNIHTHAEGFSTTASGDVAHAEGYYTTAYGAVSHIEGWSSNKAPTTMTNENGGTVAINASGLLEAWNASKNFSAAVASNSHVEGKDCIASGAESHASGYQTKASGDRSYTEGVGTIAAKQSQHAQGRYNLEDTETDSVNTVLGRYAHIVGNGKNNADRSNAHTLDWSGNAWFSGDVYVGGLSIDDKSAQKLVTEKRLNEVFGNIEATLDSIIAIQDSILGGDK